MISVVLPCRNEEESIGICIREIRNALEGSDYEIIVSDSSSDSSPLIAEKLGAVVVKHEKGYGNAYREGFKRITGDYIVMADSDCTYNFSETPKLLEKLDDGYDMVIGSRFSGEIEDGSMPWLHRHVGSPFFNFLIRRFHGVNVTDSHSGFRAIRRDALQKLDLKSPGMEFASEMLIDAKRKGLRMTEIPICYRRRIGNSKMRSFRDGWRHMKLILSEAVR